MQQFENVRLGEKVEVEPGVWAVTIQGPDLQPQCTSATGFCVMSDFTPAMRQVLLELVKLFFDGRCLNIFTKALRQGVVLATRHENFRVGHLVTWVDALSVHCGPVDEYRLIVRASFDSRKLIFWKPIV